ncbi:DNA topoisomerase 1 beta-like [Hordeum vulgare subsp. vulgare]|uniref:DNA topoisomerase I n=1 Tax=Hordeum vulgare subsp. vulgare TaxID=112509 RepID=A0A8I7B884_HORVV|nr:DNA topoisomerase 1 beta-like [Hordeum vulgare subsp. vulgare]
MPATRTFDSDDSDEFKGPAFKRSSASLKQNSMPTPSSSGNVQHCQKSTLKRPHVEDVLMVDTDDSDDDDKPLALRKKADDREFKRINAYNVDSDSEDEKPLSARLFKDAASPSGGNVSDDDDSDDDKTLAARFSLVTRNSVDMPIGPNNTALNGSASSAPRNSMKRPCDSNIQPSSALKKAKCTDSSASASSEDDGSDNVPLARRLTVGESSKRKPPAKDIAKKKKNKSSSSSKDNKKVVTKMKTEKVKSNSKVREASGGGKKWSTLEHNGVIFPPPYEPHGVKMLYNGKPVDLTPEQEEVATMFSVMKDTEYASKETFINNFFTDWSNILGKTHTIKKFELCDFTPIYEWHLREKEKKTQMTSEEKKALREEKMKQEDKFMWAFVDGVKEKVGNFRVEPPGLFRGRGEHPKMGRLKGRIRPSDITINIGEGAPVPVCPIPGESWKEVKHDNTVTWLAFWNDPINQKDFKYVFLAASSSLKGQSDKEKYEKARKLKDHIRNIRANYTKDFRSKDQVKKQIAVATYLIDKLALRAGNEKDDDEADTVGCCTLKVENVTCLPPNKLQFDFLGKDSIRYLNTVEIEPPVYKAIMEFCAGKNKGGHVFDKLDTTKLNAHLKDLMPGLTAKVFRTYNASITLDNILNKQTEDGSRPEKMNVYSRANKQVAIICNHQRAVPKSHDSQMTKLIEKIDELKAQRDEWKEDLERVKTGNPLAGDEDGKRKRKLTPQVLEIKISTIETKIKEMDITKTNREELKTVALGTSKINYLDPRITVAWCKTHEVPIEKIFSKTILAKFGWAMDVDPDFRF